MRSNRLVMLRGTAAGIGKSTLAEALVARLRGTGAAVDHVPEEDLFVRPEFAAVADGFRSRDYPGPELFEAAYRDVVAGLRRDRAWAVFDWNCAGMAGDLPWAGSGGALADHLRRVHHLADDLDPLVLDLTGTVDVATRRATAQRGRSWVDRYLALAAEAGHTTGSEEERIGAWVRGRADLDAHERAALGTAGWEVREVDALAPADQVAEEAWRVVTFAPVPRSTHR